MRLRFALVLLASLVSAAGALARSEDDFVKACLGSSNLSPEICRCSAKRAQAELSPDGFAFLVATLEKNDAATAALRTKLPLDQTMKTATFMTRGPAACAKEQAGAGGRQTE